MKEPKKDNIICASAPTSAYADGTGSCGSVATNNSVVHTKQKRLTTATTTTALVGSAEVCLSVGSLVQQPVGGMMRVELRNHIQVRRVSCRARGMGESHAPQTAYFDISLDARHGETLVCSHPTCSGSGRRFRYCSVCECPVAKRNFVKRHSHGGNPPREQPAMVLVKRQAAHSQPYRASDEVSSVASNDAPDPLKFIQKKRRRSLSVDAANTLKSIRASSDTSIAETMGDGNSGDANAESSTKSYSVQLSSTEFEWLSLLHHRPHVTDTESMSRWMESVINTSDPGDQIHLASLTRSPHMLSSPEIQHQQQAGAANGGMGPVDVSGEWTYLGRDDRADSSSDEDGSVTQV